MRLGHGPSSCTQAMDQAPECESVGWQFVNMSQLDREKSTELRQIVRVNAMRHYHKCRKQQKCEVERQCEARSDFEPAEKGEACQDERDGLSKKPQSASQSLLPMTQHTVLVAEMQKGPHVRTTAYPCPPLAAECDPLIASPCSLLGSGDSDPFCALPVSDCAQECEVLHHCKSPILRRLRL